MRLFRKIKTVTYIISRCINWPELTLMRLGFDCDADIIRLRNGLILYGFPSLSNSWGQLFEAAVADIYGIRNGRWDLIIDVGSNLGAFSALAGFSHPKARIIAFEPNEKLETHFNKNMKFNKITNVKLVSSPLTGDGREVTFSEQKNLGSSGLFLEGGINATIIKSVTLDVVDFAQAESVFFKLDCEGAEAEIIEWICHNISRLPPRIKIVCEYHPWCPIPIESTESLLDDTGFICSHISRFSESYLIASNFR